MRTTGEIIQENHSPRAMSKGLGTGTRRRLSLLREMNATGSDDAVQSDIAIITEISYNYGMEVS